MISARRIGSAAGLMLTLILHAGVGRAQASSVPLATTRETPNAFGTEGYTVTTVTATAFFPAYNQNYGTSASLGRYGVANTLIEFYAALDLPAGAVIDYIGLNSTTDTPSALGVALYNRYFNGVLNLVGTFSSTVHDWTTDFNANPIGYLWDGKTGEALVLNVEQGINPNYQYFGSVEVWWKRSLSPAPGTATFNDVPTSHPFFQYVEALSAAGITGGCGGGNYCPNNPVTRGQMAVFLAKALGLHWPGN